MNDEVVLPAGITIRPLEAGDIDAVVSIEREAFTTPWQPETFAGLIDREAVELTVMTAPSGEIVGYSVLWCILDQGELANIAITPSHRGGGLGAHLLGHVLGVAAEKGVQKVFLEVRASNDAALGLYRRYGFTEAGRRANYYERPREDALVMVATLTPAP